MSEGQITFYKDPAEGHEDIWRLDLRFPKEDKHVGIDFYVERGADLKSSDVAAALAVLAKQLEDGE